MLGTQEKQEDDLVEKAGKQRGNDWVLKTMKERRTGCYEDTEEDTYPCLNGSGVAEAFLEKGDLGSGHLMPQGTGYEKVSPLSLLEKNLACSKPHC